MAENYLVAEVAFNWSITSILFDTWKIIKAKLYLLAR